jgi:hypothetical protein
MSDGASHAGVVLVEARPPASKDPVVAGRDRQLGWGVAVTLAIVGVVLLVSGLRRLSRASALERADRALADEIDALCGADAVSRGEAARRP